MINKTIKIFAFILFALAQKPLSLNAQESLRYVSLDHLDVKGKASHDGPILHRIDTAMHRDLPDNIKKLMTQSSGLYITFKTDSRQISAKWCTSPAKTFANLPGIAFEGLDLYIKRGSNWEYAGVGRPQNNSDHCQTTSLVQHMEAGNKECILYLPLYDETIDLQIGIDSLASFENVSNDNEKKSIVLYGTSIAQGASASRPGLSYPARISRNLNIEIINWGVSGSAKMEKSVSRLIGETPMDMLIIDCIPNCSPQHIQERTTEFLREIRQKHPNLPILAISGAAFESGNFNTKIAEDMRLRNHNFEQQIQTLMQQDKELYWLGSEDLLGTDHEGTIDGTHPNDLGFDRMIKKIQPFLENILLKHGLL